MKGYEYKNMSTGYFVSLYTRDWVDIFERPVYKQLIVHSLNHFSDQKGLVVYAWCLMSSHLFLLIRSDGMVPVQELVTAFRVFTEEKILAAADTEPEPRRKWILSHFRAPAGFMGLQREWQLWEEQWQPIHIDMANAEELLQQFEFIHQQPVHELIVDAAPDYRYSSARDYAGSKGLVQIRKIPNIENELAASSSYTSRFVARYLRR
jgi:hypothetical protein